MTALRSLLFLCAVLSTTVLAAQTSPTPPALPAWPDESPSVYAAARTVASPINSSPEPAISPQQQPVQPAAFTAPTEPVEAAAEPGASDSRRLAPRRNRLARPHEQTKTDAAELPSFGVPLDSMYTTAAALAVVLGLFLLCAGLVRRGAKKSNSRLPEEVVSVLGRVPLAARQYAELVRVGNKLVLVSITPTGAEPLTEITDPAEIDRLLGLCKQGTKGSSTAEFDQVFRQLAEETAPRSFLGREAPRQDARLDTRLAAATDVFAAYRGGAKVG